MVARKIEPSVLRVRITRTSFGEIVYESFFVLEIVNSTSAAQKAKMIPSFLFLFEVCVFEVCVFEVCVFEVCVFETPDLN